MNERVLCFEEYICVLPFSRHLKVHIYMFIIRHRYVFCMGMCVCVRVWLAE